MLMPMAATEGEFLLMSGKSRCSLTAWRDEMMSRGRQTGGTKQCQDEKKCCRANATESVNDCL